MQVAKISAELAQELTGKEMVENWYFNPVQDGNGDWIVSLIEAEHLLPNQYVLIDYVPLKNGEIN